MFKRLSLIMILLLAPYITSCGETDKGVPKLILLIVIDQLRNDVLWKNRDKFGGDGFRYLFDNGIYYTNTHYKHATTLTAVGHATIGTGANPSDHGIVGNDWINKVSDRLVYSVQDERHEIVCDSSSNGEGLSPANLRSTTIGDELVTSTNSKSKVFSVSIKDRAAILLAGHLGKAFWYSTDCGQFVSSTYYYQKYPEWYSQWTKEHSFDDFRNHTWTLLNQKASYASRDADDRDYERSYKYLGRTFPHSLSYSDSRAYYSAIRFTPVSDELTMSLGSEIIEKELLGQRKTTDMISISFSAQDYIGHAFGPNSLEAEDNLLRLDAILAKLFNKVETLVGLRNTLVILTSDHGISESPEYYSFYGLPAGRHNTELLLKKINKELRGKLNIGYDLVTDFWNPGLYINEKLAREHNIPVPQVEELIAQIVEKMPGFAKAYTSTQLIAGDIPNDHISTLVLNGFNAERSGNVILVQSPYWYLYHDSDKYAAMHGSPYKYDTHVPLLFASLGNTKRETVTRLVDPRDIAVTIHTLYGYSPPSHSSGMPLKEVLSAYF